jgi:hypothetical protein
MMCARCTAGRVRLCIYIASEMIRLTEPYEMATSIFVRSKRVLEAHAENYTLSVEVERLVARHVVGEFSPRKASV